MKGIIMTNEISLVFLFKILKSSWWKILIITLVVMLLVAAVTEFAIDKQYSSSTEFYIINSSVTSEYTTSALLSAVEYLANDYIEIILGDRMIDQIIQDLTAKGYTGCTPSNVRAMISAKTSAESSIFQITVTHTDKNVAYYVSESIKENAPKIIREISRPSYVSNMYRKETVKNENGETVDKYVLITEADLECVTVIRSPELARTHVSPSLLKNTFIGGVLAACLAYAIFLIRKLFDTTIRSEESAKELVEHPIIGDIPTWNVGNANNANTENKAKQTEKN
ncbi:MAG: hypothetical protein IJY08_04480 [Clostridia bacterium]|nr:hypothetical protein [Clostridia bacterium]